MGKNRPCPHLESIISKGTKSGRETPWPDVSRVQSSHRDKKEQQITNLFIKLKTLGLTELEAAVLVFYTVYEWSLEDIADFLKIEGRNKVYSIYRQAKIAARRAYDEKTEDPFI